MIDPNQLFQEAARDRRRSSRASSTEVKRSKLVQKSSSVSKTTTSDRPEQFAGDPDHSVTQRESFELRTSDGESQEPRANSFQWESRYVQDVRSRDRDVERRQDPEKCQDFGIEQDFGSAPCVKPPVHRYVDGNAYRVALGRSATQTAVVDSQDWRSAMAVIDLRREKPSADEFVRVAVRELRIRDYDAKTVKSYGDAVTSLLRWSGRLPHEMNRDLVREYLEYLVDSEKGSSMRSVHLSAIRTIFDKMCFLDITLGLRSPRRGKHLPIVLSRDEICRLLQAAPSFRDKLLLGLMYATGIRVSEVVRLRWRDIELDRNMIAIRGGKGDVDRQVMLPSTYRTLFAGMKAQCGGETYLFPGENLRRGNDNSSRYLSIRTVQRVMASAVRLAGIDKKATPHSLRHSFATHSFEGGCDIRRIQKILGHVHLETTTIYVKVAKPSDPTLMPSPIDKLDAVNGLGNSHGSKPIVAPKVHFRRFAGEDVTRVTLEYASPRGPVYLTGGRAQELRPGYWTLQVPLIDTWSKESKRLGHTERMQLQNAELYEWLRIEVGRRLSRGRVSQAA